MANDFKNAQAVGVTSVTTIYTSPAAKTSILLELDIANTTQNVVEASVEIFDTSASTDAFLVKNAPVPSGGTLQVVAGQKIILEATDIVKVTATGAVDVVAAILEDVNS
tara:strand:+ start:31 stop:357 length:327 start_codon:yes stop_codon:yes gene_type:complete